ncbi:MAG: hypothetical protein GX897_04430 [Clostridiales bacterium]|nr:hypothetical protein [Clostridiales bacterium]
MILKPLETTVAYRCPECGGMVVSPVGAFVLTGDMFRLKCPCGGSALEIQLGKDKARLTVPCVVCPRPHYFNMSRQLFFSRDIFTLGCTYTSIDCAFIGRADKVREAYDEATRTLADMMGVGADEIDFSDEAARSAYHPDGDEDADGLKDDEPPDDEPLSAFFESTILTAVAALRDEGRVSCCCSNAALQDLDFEFIRGGVNIFCKTCGASRKVYIPSENAAVSFAMEAGELRLE